MQLAFKISYMSYNSVALKALLKTVVLLLYFNCIFWVILIHDYIEDYHVVAAAVYTWTS